MTFTEEEIMKRSEPILSFLPPLSCVYHYEYRQRKEHNCFEVPIFSHSWRTAPVELVVNVSLASSLSRELLLLLLL